MGFDECNPIVRSGSLSIENLDDPTICWLIEEVSRLWTLATERSGNPEIDCPTRI